jgi:hypothetical protein
LLAIVPMVAAIGYSLLQPRTYYTGTDSVGVRSVVATLPGNKTLCIPDLSLPAGTGALQIAASATGRTPPLTATVQIGNRVVARGLYTSALPLQDVIHVTIPLSPVLPASPRLGVGTVCVSAGRGAPLALGGFAGLPATQPSPTIAGRPINAGVALWFLPPAGQTRSLFEAWPAIMHRLTPFRPGFAGDVFYWLLFLVGLPLLAYCALRLLAVAGEPGRRLVLGLALVGFASAAIWAITTVPFDSPDESEHFAYTESIAETGRAPDAAPTARTPYAEDEVFALDAVHHFSVIEVGDARPPWLPRDEHVYLRRVAQFQPKRTDGGGFSVATQAHSPLYYTVLVPGYELGHSGGTFTELFWMRLISALLGAIVVVATFGTVRELIPSRPELAVASSLIVAFQPMFGFISGAVNNDNGVNALAALSVYLTVRALRRGISWRLGLALGASAALMPIMKGTGLALLPAIAIALVALVALRRSRVTLVGVGAAVASFAAVAGIWDLVAGAFQRSASTTAGGAGVASGQLGGKLEYLWEVFLPRLPFMAEHWAAGFSPFMLIYIRRGFAAFGWYAIFFPHWVYYVIVAVIGLLSLLALAAAIRLRPVVVRRWPEALFLVLVILGVIAGVEFAFYAATPRPVALTPEQGRYAFTAIVPLAALALVGLVLLPRRWGKAASAVLVGAMICLAAASHLLYLASNFT